MERSVEKSLKVIIRELPLLCFIVSYTVADPNEARTEIHGQIFSKDKQHVPNSCRALLYLATHLPLPFNDKLKGSISVEHIILENILGYVQPLCSVHTVAQAYLACQIPG